MPEPSNRQSFMGHMNGNTPALNDQLQIDDIAFRLRTSAKAADYTVLQSDSGTWFTTEGATAAVNFTLPAPTGDDCDGAVYFFYNAEDIDMTVTSGTADLMIAQNDVAADSVAFSTTSLKIGGCVMVVGDGAKWMVAVLSDGNTVTVGT